MVSLLDTRPPGINVLFRPGDTLTITLTWPSGSLTGRSFSSFLGAETLTVGIVGDVMTVSATGGQTTAVNVAADWVLTETTSGGSNEVLIGRWVPSTNPSAQSSTSVTVTEASGEVAVSVSGQAELAAQTTRSALESLGAQVPQAAATTLHDRFIAFIKNAGSGAPNAGWNYTGGDVPDCVHIPSSSDALWIFADGFDGSGVDATTELYTGSPLPVRNGAILEQTLGTFTGAIQIYRSGSSGLWMDAVVDGGHAANHIWWPIGLIDDGGVYKVACWLVESPAAAGEPHGRLVDSHIVTLGGFLTYGSHVQTGLGSLTDNFWVSRMWRDTTHTYVTGMQFVPPFDARTTAAPTAPNYVFDNPRDHYSLTRIGRVTNGSLGTVASWQYWNGSAWVSGVTNAQPMVDVDGNEIRGDTGITKISSTHYVLAAHKLMDTHLDVYKAAAPQGPWTQISRVPLVTQGHSVNGPNTYQVGQLVSILPTQVQAPPAEHRIAIISRNTIVPTVGYSAEEAFTLRNIRRYAPQFAVIPTI